MTSQNTATRVGQRAAILIHRTGFRPLEFNGVLLARSLAERGDKRKHTIALHRTDAGKFVASLEFESGWKGELSHHAARVADTLDEAARWLEALQPDRWVRGYPRTDAYAAKQHALLKDITHELGVQVSLLLASINATEVIA